jgi:hypothetical protein
MTSGNAEPRICVGPGIGEPCMMRRLGMIQREEMQMRKGEIKAHLDLF